jgi:hypothetical protein
MFEKNETPFVKVLASAKAHLHYMAGTETEIN